MSTLGKPRESGGLIVLFALAVAVGVLTSLVSDASLFVMSTIEVYAMVPAVLAFPVAYTLFFPWWQTRIGRSLFIFSSSLGGLVTVSAVYQILGDDYPLRDEVRFFVFSWILIGVWYLLYSLVRTRYDVPSESRGYWWRSNNS